MAGLEPPGVDQLEISIFGSGYGECVAVHLGEGEWLIVDSCRDKNTGRLPVLDYLQSIGVDAAVAVRLVVASHWHDDHVAGFADLVRACESAEVLWSAAVSSEEIWALADADAARANPLSRRVLEMRDTFAIVSAGHAGRTTPTWTVEALPVFERETGVPCEVVALAPSNKAVTVMSTTIANLLASGRPCSEEPNHSSVVLHVRVGESVVLLTGDLETTPDSEMGWDAVLNVFARRRLRSAAQLKIPHHGSPNAEHDGIWGVLCRPKPIGVAAPWRNAGDHRPREADVIRLATHLEALFLCAPGEWPAGEGGDRPRAGRPRRRKFPPTGRVTVRRESSGDPWTVDLQHPARQCC